MSNCDNKHTAEFDTEFRVGNRVRLKDGDGRSHIIKSIDWEQGIRGDWYATVEFEDKAARGIIWDNGKKSDMELMMCPIFEVKTFSIDNLIELSNKEYNKCKEKGCSDQYSNGVYDGIQLGFDKAKDYILRELYNELLNLRGKDIEGDELLRKFEWKYIK